MHALSGIQYFLKSVVVSCEVAKERNKRWIERVGGRVGGEGEKGGLEEGGEGRKRRKEERGGEKNGRRGKVRGNGKGERGIGTGGKVGEEKEWRREGGVGRKGDD